MIVGLDALGYEEHLDYDIAQSTNPEFGNAIVRVNVFRDHRQTVQYIAPEDAHGESYRLLYLSLSCFAFPPRC
jgi:tRNA(Met) C34 N-acetyltransferase TmcA